MSGSGVVKVETLEQYDAFFRAAVMNKLGKDREALKLFEVKWAELSDQDRKDLVANGMSPKLVNIAGALGLDDSGIGWRAFSVQIEEGLSHEQDAELADSLAHQCLVCVAQMKREHKKGGAVHHVN
jgi:hypothetical protein